MNNKSISVGLGDRAYDIHVGTGFLNDLSAYVPEHQLHKDAFIIADDALQGYIQQFESALNGHCKTLFLKGGENTKSWKSYQDCCEWLLANGLKRDCVIYAIGGGVIGDLVGFIAATVMRGVDFIQVPTTLLAQVDSSVGGKTGINTRSGKNLVGAFYQPKTVLADIDVLKTLPKRQILAGYAEIVKYGLINDIEFFEWLEDNGDKVCDLSPVALSHAIETSVKAKANIVEQDERESGVRALLNLGHTFAHVLEAAAMYDGRLLHGEAVAIGTIMAFETSCRLGFCPREDITRIHKHFQQLNLPTQAGQIMPGLDVSAADLVAMMAKDKKADKNSIKFIMAKGIGRSFICADVDMDVVETVIKDSLES